MQIVKKALFDQKYDQIGRLPKFYCAEDRVRIPNERLEVWPGYVMSIKCLNDGIFLNIDATNKFVSRTSIHEKIKQL